MEYKNLIISIDECANSTYDGKCASQEEIHDFLETNAIYVYNKETNVSINMY